LDLLAVLEFIGLAFHDDAAGFNHIAALRNIQGNTGVLFNE
jgi:hypothetical protein